MTVNVGKINELVVNSKSYRTSGNIKFNPDDKFFSPGIASNKPPVSGSQESTTKSFLSKLGEKFQEFELA